MMQARGRNGGERIPPADPAGEPGTREAARSLPRVTRDWYVLATSDELGGEPIGRKLFGQPIVLFRDESGAPAALLDRCAHRNVPLSRGRRLASGRLECGYHGWQYDGAGACVAVPSLCGAPPFKRTLVPSYPTRELEGYVWVYATADLEPTRAPFSLPDETRARGYTVVRRVVETEASLLATLENALDVPHTAFLHKGLFRGAGERHRIRAVLRRSARRVEIDYVGEPRPSGLVGRLLSPSGGVVRHTDRFILPSVAQVEYAIGDESHFLVTALATPVDDYVTRIYAAIAFKLPLPGWLVRPFLEPVAMRIFGQDAAILRRQSDAARRFGGEHYTSTELDLVGPQALRLLRRAEAAPDAGDDDETFTREIDLEV
jgi:phenylpropionate dioxygenase-like ring-hydroxylating dioxygenase large terminal subunit